MRVAGEDHLFSRQNLSDSEGYFAEVLEEHV
jgi:hypothetical protein